LEIILNTLIEKENHYCAHNYEPLPVVLTKGEGIHLWDDTGKQYIDMMSAYSAVSFGHSNPILVDALTQQARTLAITSRAFYTDKLAAFVEHLSQLTGFEKVLPMNTGAEAVETALKAARKWAYTVKEVPEDRAEIIACEGNFHGRTLAVVGLSTEQQYRNGFGPYPAGLHTIPFGNAAALQETISPNTAAFLVEPIQGENGIVLPPAGYLSECKKICEKNNVLMICDEIQTGLGRTGALFAYQHDDFQPDGLILGKALGGGLLPVSAFLANDSIMHVFSPGDHGSTFGGNPLGAVVGLEALLLLQKDNLVEKSRDLGNYFLLKLQSLKLPFIKEIRGKGLFIGIDLHPELASAREICLALMEKGILSKETHQTVIRLAPPLIITKEQLDTAFAIIKQTLENWPTT
jgi:ornithine--oxo-acid transaminase